MTELFTDESIETKLQAQTVCYQLHVKMPGLRRKADKSMVDMQGADADMMGLSKTIVDSDEYRAIQRHIRYMKAFLVANALPSPVFKGGVYQLPIPLVENVAERIETMKGEFQEIVTSFVNAYEGAGLLGDGTPRTWRQSLKELARERLGPQFNEDDYPDAEKIRNQFSIETCFLDTDVPTKLRSISPTIFEAEKLRAQQRWQSVEEDAKILLRSEMKRLIDKMAESLGETEDGRKKSFRQSNVDRLSEFLSNAPFRNVINDQQLDELVNVAKRFLDGVDVESVRKDDKYRNVVRESFETIQGRLNPLVTDSPQRLISFGDEEV